MSSPRNVAILGLSICVGFAIPFWAQAEETPVEFGKQDNCDYCSNNIC
jgi:hypothetical protein